MTYSLDCLEEECLSKFSKIIISREFKIIRGKEEMLETKTLTGVEYIGT